MPLRINYAVILTFLVSSDVLIPNACAATVTNRDWWKHAVFYQIYPRSFQDSDGDGIGDLQGIINRLGHLKDAGITAAWLSPIYASPQVDQGYDISNYTEINPEYGTMDDFVKLINASHAIGIKIIMDFVPNHSSDKHDWFKLSENRTAGYENYYVWCNASEGKPPNNWISIFQNSAWQYSSIRNQSYLHQFTKEQPDLNYRDPGVVTAMKDVLTFWLDKGVDGFRMDAVPMLVEDTKFLDEPRSNIPNAPSSMSSYLRHVYTQDQPETFDVIYDWRKHLDKYTETVGGDPRIMMTEAYTNIDSTMYYFGNEEKDGAHFTFNFFMITDLNVNSTARDIAFTIEKWVKNMPARYTSNWVLGNHDNKRVATRFGAKNVDGYHMLIALLPGVMVSYNGEEIGQEDGKVTWEQGKDPNACLGPKEDFEYVTRDVARTPFQWDNTTSAGFSTNTTTWLPVSSKYKETNLAAQKNSSVSSHYQIYKNLTKLRQNPAFKTDVLVIRAVSDNVLVFSRNYSYVILLNIGNSNVNVSIDKDIFSASHYLEIVLASVTSSRNAGDLISTMNIHLTPHESLVAVKTAKFPSTTVPPTSVTTKSPNNGTSVEPNTKTLTVEETTTVSSTRTSSTTTPVPNGVTIPTVSITVQVIIGSASLHRVFGYISY